MFGERILQRAGRNPFYLLSALFMLLGCFAVSRHLTLVPGQWKLLVVLIGILQVYELLLLALARYLNRRGHTRADSTTLFLLCLAFLVDVTYLNAEFAAAHPWVAPWVALALHVLAAVKLVLLRDALGITSRRALALALAQVGVLLYLPGAVSTFYFTDDKMQALGAGAEVLPRLLYGLWWLVGFTPLALAWADRARDGGIGRAAVMLPFASLFLHSLSLHWLYGLPFHARYVTPLLLGMSTYACLTFVRQLDPLRVVFQWAAPVFSLLFSLWGPDLIDVTWNGIHLVITPLRIALVGLALIWILYRELTRERAFGIAATTALLVALSGHGPSSMARNWASVAPESALELGVASIVAAFAFLALGLAKSLLRPRTNDSSPGRRLVSS